MSISWLLMTWWPANSQKKLWDPVAGLIGHVTLVAINGTTKPTPYHSVKSLQLIWRLGTDRRNLWIPNLHMSNSNLIKMTRWQDSGHSNGYQWACLHYNTMTWKHFLHYWHFVRRIHHYQRISLTNVQLCRTLMFPLLLAWITCWTNS